MTGEDPNEWMWFRALTMLERAEYLRHGLSQLQSGRQTVWQPPVDMFEVGNVLWIIVALPGVASGSVKVLVKSDILIIKGERQLPLELRRSVVHRLEIPHGRFERRMELPLGNYELSDHHIVDGCLIMKLNQLRRHQR